MFFALSRPDLHTQPSDQIDDIAEQQTAPVATAPKQSSGRQMFLALWREALLPYLGTRLVLLIVGLLGTYYIMPLLAHNPNWVIPSSNGPFPETLWSMWKHFDSGFYIAIAHYGYQPASALHTRSNWAFFPLYPWLISGLARPLASDDAGYALTGLLISHMATLVAIGYFYALVRQEWGRRVASYAVLYLALFPLSFYLSAVYPESLFLALAIASIYYARRQIWWLAGLCGGLAALTRIQGIMLLLPVAFEYLRVVSLRYTDTSISDQPMIPRLTEYRRGIGRAVRHGKNWLTALNLLLIPAGLLVFMLYAKWQTGDLLATFHTERWGWGRYLSPPWRLLIYSLRNPILGQPLDWNFWILNIILAFAALAFLVWAWRKLPPIYALYTTVMVLLPLSSNFINSFGRYCIIIFPAFILLALRGSRSEHLHAFILCSFAALEAVFALFFVLGIPAIA
jgi:hypothetical protein